MSQIDGKWIKDNTVEGNHIRLKNGECLKGRNFANTGNVDIIMVAGSDEAEFCTKARHPFLPVNNEDLVNKGYVLDVLAGLRDPKDAVIVATTANIDLATGGLLTIDGLTVFDGARVLVKDQTNQAENGIYNASTGAWTRSTDADTVAELTEGASCLVLEGLVNARKLYVMQYGIGTIDVDPVQFVQAPNPANFLVPVTLNATISAGDITNGYVELVHKAENGSVEVTPLGGPEQEQGSDYTLSEVGGLTRVNFAGDLAARIAAGDKLLIKYSYATS